MSLLFVISAVFFAFPLLSPAIGIVLYPFLLDGLGRVVRWRTNGRTAIWLVLLIAPVLMLTIVDPVAVVRIIAFAFGLAFLHQCMRSDSRRRLLLTLAAVHAWVVILQLILVIAGIPLDFSAVFRAIYGGLLPPTGIHIDYNAFSQLDLFIPRVAGLSREPAFASVFFLGFTFVAWRSGHRKHIALFAAATLCTLSKIIFPLILALAIVACADTTRHRRWTTTCANALIISALHLVVILAVYFMLEEAELAMALDASFYHRIIGLHTFATQWDNIPWIGNGMDLLSRANIFATYEFLDDKRAFLDGSVISKVAVDFGYAGLIVYVAIVSAVCTRWQAAVALSIGGMFINLLSVSPATILLFWLLSGRFASVIPRRTAGHRYRSVHPSALSLRSAIFERPA